LKSVVLGIPASVAASANRSRKSHQRRCCSTLHSPHFLAYHSQPVLLNSLQHWPVERLRWFTKGFYKVEARNQEVQISDLRMALEADYVFRFKVAGTIALHVAANLLSERVATRTPEQSSLSCYHGSLAARKDWTVNKATGH
tara:strand:- start:17013 stop:17438 length:426 start_codon:yes stop_codon:yes gene_type:complete